MWPNLVQRNFKKLKRFRFPWTPKLLIYSGIISGDSVEYSCKVSIQTTLHLPKPFRRLFYVLTFPGRLSHFVAANQCVQEFWLQEIRITLASSLFERLIRKRRFWASNRRNEMLITDWKSVIFIVLYRDRIGTKTDENPINCKSYSINNQQIKENKNDFWTRP